MTELRNDPSRRGELAAPKKLFGEWSRYAIAPVHTRFGAVAWFVWDAMSWGLDGTNPAVIRIEESKAAALEGLI